MNKFMKFLSLAMLLVILATLPSFHRVQSMILPLRKAFMMQ